MSGLKEYRSRYDTKIRVTDPNVQTIEDEYSSIGDKKSGVVSSQQKTTEKAAQLQVVEDNLSKGVMTAFALRNKVLERALEVKKSREKYYTWCTRASYITYPLGWLIGFLGTIFEVKGLAVEP